MVCLVAGKKAAGPLLVFMVLLALLPSGARADDQPFLTLYSTDIDTQAEKEVEQWLGWKTGQTGKSYNEFTSRSEFEYGITDELQGSLYLNYDWSREREGGGPADTQSFAGVSGELIYQVMNVYFDPFGLAFYLEPTYSGPERSIETKILLQKNFFNDTLRLVFNTNFEDRWNHEQGHRAKTSGLEFDTGLAYNITPELSAGIEFDNERDYEGLIIGTPSSQQTSAFYIGPTIYYIGHPITVTFGVQAQLPWGGNSAHVPGAVTNGFVSDAERFRATLRLSHDF